MGYDLHITRASEWFESEKAPILLEEWKAYVNADAEFRLDNYAESKTPAGHTLRYESEGLAVWTAYSGNPQDRGAWFDYLCGRIVVKNPDTEIQGKMKRVATALGARVLGDEGEEY